MPCFRSALVPPEGAAGGERGLPAGAGRRLAQAAVLVWTGGWAATTGAQGADATRAHTRCGLCTMRSVTNAVYICVCEVVDLPSTLKVEVYPVEIFLCLHSNMDHVVSRQFSRADTICECVCVRECCKVFIRINKTLIKVMFYSHSSQKVNSLEFSVNGVLFVCRFHPVCHVRCVECPCGLRVPTVDEKFGEQLRTPA